MAAFGTWESGQEHLLLKRKEESYRNALSDTSRRCTAVFQFGHSVADVIGVGGQFQFKHKQYGNGNYDDDAATERWMIERHEYNRASGTRSSANSGQQH